MSDKALTEEMKTRVPKAVKDALKRLAEKRQLDVSDIVREALREFIKASSGKA